MAKGKDTAVSEQTPRLFVEEGEVPRHRAVGNMTLDGGDLVEAGVRAGTGAQWMSTSNLVVKDFTGPGIHFEEVGRRVSIMNNTVVDCGGGIRVDAVRGNGSESRAEAGIRIWDPSFVENNLIYNCTQYGIKIGNGGTPGTAAVWSPILIAGQPYTKNPISPVGYNIVINPEAPPTVGSFAGDTWYLALEEGGVRPNGEAAYNCVDPSYPVFVNYDAGDYRLNASLPSELCPNPSQTLGAGSPMRLDILAGTETEESPLVMRRSVGAFASHVAAHYSAWEGEGE